VEKYVEDVVITFFRMNIPLVCKPYMNETQK